MLNRYYYQTKLTLYKYHAEFMNQTFCVCRDSGGWCPAATRRVDVRLLMVLNH